MVLRNRELHGRNGDDDAYALGFCRAVHYLRHLLSLCLLALEVQASLNAVLMACHRFKRTHHRPRY